MTEPNCQIAVVGAGRMGRGIALSFACAGYPVSLVDSELRNPVAATAATAAAAAELQAESRSLADTGLLSYAATDALAAQIKIFARTDGADVLRTADFIFEAVVEDLGIKRSTYAWLGEVSAERAILASTTSTILADTLAGFVAHPQRFTNAHWLNPAYLMPLIEISPAQHTGADVVAALRALLEAIGKVPIVCRASPGYVVARIQALVLNEAARLVEEGVASAADVDRAMRAGFGPRYTVFGPLEFIDWGGGDILYLASRYLAGTLDATRFSTPDIVQQNMQAGRNGMREGLGFYDWSDVDVDAFRADRLTALTNLLGHLDLLPAMMVSEDV